MLSRSSFTITSHIILSKPLAAFLHNHYQNIGQQLREEQILPQRLSLFLSKTIAKLRIEPATSFSQALYAAQRPIQAWVKKKSSPSTSCTTEYVTCDTYSIFWPLVHGFKMSAFLSDHV